MKTVFTTGEAAKICKVSQQTIIRCFDNGQLKGFRVPGSRFRRIPREALYKFMKDNGIPTDALESGKRKVLLVDDDPDLVELMHRMLDEELVHHLDDVDVVVDEQHLALAALQGVGRDLVVPHEAVQRLPRDPPELRPGHPEALQLAIVETADDGLLTDFANLRGFAGREYSLHVLIHPLRALARRTSGVCDIQSAKTPPTGILLDPPLPSLSADAPGATRICLRCVGAARCALAIPSSPLPGIPGSRPGAQDC